jgi:hypothetical protein
MTKVPIWRYTGAMMKKSLAGRLTLPVFIVIIFLSAQTLIAAQEKESYPLAFDLRADTGWYASIPSAFHDDPLPLRSHYMVNVSAYPVVFKLFDTVGLSTGLSFSYVTESLAYGTSIWRPFFALGPILDVTIPLRDRLSVTVSASYSRSVYAKTSDYSDFWRFAIIGEWELLNSEQSNHRLALNVPVQFDVRSDYLSVSAGIGIRWRYVPAKKGEEVKQYEAVL